jgi:MFS family permease
MIPLQTGDGAWRVFSAEALSSIGQNFLVTGIFFYTQHRLGWSLIANLLLAAGQGLVYTVGALLAGRMAQRTGRRGGLIGLYGLMTLAALAGLWSRADAWIILPLLAYTFALAMSWPMLESLASAGAGLDAHRLSRRIGAYNLVWAGVGVLAIAVEGALIERWPLGVFLIPLVAHVACAGLMWRHREPTTIEASPDSPHLSPEPALLAQRTQALWLSRIALPATYVVEYSLMAMMPSLPVLRSLSATAQTLIGSVWMGGRWIIFLIMGMTHLWHTRPRLLLASVVAMGAAFFGVTIRLSPWFGVSNLAVDLTSMILWQCVLGAAVGIIYYASLYFGMVLSQGSTEHGGYHEALIGLGSILGPGFAAMAAVWWPGRLNAGLAAVGVVIAASILGAGAVTVRNRKTP